MCYSAQVEQELKAIRNALKAEIDMAAFERVFRQRLNDDHIKIPKAMEANFYQPTNQQEQVIHDLINEYHQRKTRELETGLFKQKARLVDAERILRSKTTKKALTDQRVARNKVQWHLEKIADLKRTELKDSDARIYPFYYAPVVITENGRRLIRPMRYHCRPSGKPESYDRQYDGLYNARRDNLEGFWRGQFGKTHGIVLMTGFFENVSRHRFEKRDLRDGEQEENVILHFNPKPAFQMKVACLWSHWAQEGMNYLESFAAITDEPPPEISAAGHDRCIIPLTESAVNLWLTPAQDHQRAMDVLDLRERPHYEHRLAA